MANMTPFAVVDYRHLVQQLAELAKQTDRGIVLADALVDLLRQQCIILPVLDVIGRVCSETLTHGTRQVYEALPRRRTGKTSRPVGVGSSPGK